MGFIMENHGHIGIENRRESFVIHPDYGYKPKVVPLEGLPLLTEVGYQGRVHKVVVAAEDYVTLREEQFSTTQDLPPSTTVTLIGHEEAAEGTYAAWWREAGHPEFPAGDLDDLIAALEALREHRRAKS